MLDVFWQWTRWSGVFFSPQLQSKTASLCLKNDSHEGSRRILGTIRLGRSPSCGASVRFCASSVFDIAAAS